MNRKACMLIDTISISLLLICLKLLYYYITHCDSLPYLNINNGLKKETKTRKHVA